jgi:hypothetical protein
VRAPAPRPVHTAANNDRVRTVELLLDPALDHAVRDLWRRLHRAGLRSLATHTHPTNRPHLTMATADRIDAVPAIELPLPIRLGPVRSLGRALVLAADSPELRTAHARINWALVELRPGPWVPHVSLALNMPADQHESAMALLGESAVMTGECVAARSYDSETRTVSDIRWGDAESR